MPSRIQQKGPSPKIPWPGLWKERVKAGIRSSTTPLKA